MRISLGSLKPGDPCYDPSYKAGYPGAVHGSTNLFSLFFGSDVSGYSAAEVACNTIGAPALTLTPALNTALTTGTPVSYDPETGLVTNNTTGETNPQSLTVAQALNQQLSPGLPLDAYGNPVPISSGISTTTIILISALAALLLGGFVSGRH